MPRWWGAVFELDRAAPAEKPGATVFELADHLEARHAAARAVDIWGGGYGPQEPGTVRVIELDRCDAFRLEPRRPYTLEATS